MRALYTALYTLIFPFVLLRLFWRSRKLPAYRQRWRERLGILPDLKVQASIWVHAVSVGEVIAAIPLIKSLQACYPGYRFVVTTMTPTGAERVRALLDTSVTHLYLPYDLPVFIKGFLKKVQPKILLIIETELWPNLIAICARQNTPCVLVNGRLSEKSAMAYQKGGSLIRTMLKKMHLLLVQNENTEGRFKALGADGDKLRVTGSIKYDLKLPDEQIALGKVQRKNLAFDGLLLVAASTHPGEEALLLRTLTKVLAQGLQVRLIIVPRHPDRFTEVYELACLQPGLKVKRRSLGQLQDDWQVLIGDSMGEMFYYFAMADLVFMGGSLVPRGGHNYIEPAALGLAILSGPHYFNFQEIGDQLRAMNAVQVVNDETGLISAIKKHQQDRRWSQAAGEQGRTWVNKNKGALSATLTSIAAILGDKGQ